MPDQRVLSLISSSRPFALQCCPLVAARRDRSDTDGRWPLVMVKKRQWRARIDWHNLASLRANLATAVSEQNSEKGLVSAQTQVTAHLIRK